MMSSSKNLFQTVTLIILVKSAPLCIFTSNQSIAAFPRYAGIRLLPLRQSVVAVVVVVFDSNGKS